MTDSSSVSSVGTGSDSGTSASDSSTSSYSSGSDYSDFGGGYSPGDSSSDYSSSTSYSSDDKSNFDSAYGSTSSSDTDYQSDTTADGTSVFSPATWASESQEDLGFADQTLGFFKGAYDVGKDAVIGTAELAYDVAATGYDSTLGAPYKAVDIFSEALTGEEIEWASWAPDMDRGAARLEAGYDNARALVDDPGLIVDAVVDPIQEDWTAGRYGEALGGATVGIASTVFGLKGLDKSAKAGTVARQADADDIATAQRRADESIEPAVQELDAAGLVELDAKIANATDVVRGPASGREYYPEFAGGPIRNLDYNDYEVTQEGLADVRTHVGRFDEYSPNAFMLDRLQRIVDGDLEPGDVDLIYYSHELEELQRYRNVGIPDGVDTSREIWENLHAATLEDFRINEETKVNGQIGPTLYHVDTWGTDE